MNLNPRAYIPELFPDSTADETPRRIGFIGILLYSVYSLFFALGAPLVAITNESLFGGIAFIALALLLVFIIIYYPFKLTRQFYATGVITPTRNSLYMCGISTFMSAISGVLFPLAIYNLVLAFYYYKHSRQNAHGFSRG